MASDRLDGRSGWTLVAAGAALIATCYGLARFAYGLFAPEFRAEFGISSTVSGVIAAGSYVGYCVAIVVSLVLTERYGARGVAVSAGVLATVGTGLVALAPSAWVLAAGVLIAGTSTGVASPPLAAAVSRSIRAGIQDRAQTVVNAGTGLGVLVSGPVALAMADQWRWAWTLFAVTAGLVTVWVRLVVPAARSEGSGDRGGRERGYVPGAGAMTLAAFLMGMSSAAVWTFGRDVVATVGGASDLVSSSMWTVLGAAGIAGALGGDLVARVGLARSWSAGLVVMAAATGLLVLAPGTAVAIFLSAAIFGAAYIMLTALVLVWSTRLYPRRAAFGVGLGFLMIAVGQAIGASLTGYLTDAFDVTVAFFACAALGLLGALVRPGNAVSPAS